MAAAQEESTRSGARATALEGARAMQQERWADAVALFKRAESLVHAPPHLLYMARAYVKLGKLVDAREAYQKIVHDELPATAPKAFLDARSAAFEEEAALAPRLASLRISVAGEQADKAVVMVDGVELPHALVGVAHPADPGPHKLSASAPGWAADEVSVTLREGGRETVDLVLSRKERIAESPGTGDESRKRGLRTAGWITLGVGVAGLGAGTFFLLQNRSKRDDSATLCPGTVCPAANRAEMTSLDDAADRAATFSLIGYGIGAAGVIGGATLLLLSRSPNETPIAGVQPWVGLGSAGVAGHF